MKVFIGVVGDALDYLVSVIAKVIAVSLGEEVPETLCVGGNLSVVEPKPRYRSPPCDDCVFSVSVGRGDLCSHFVKVGEGSAYVC